MTAALPTGVLAPVITPFRDDLEVDTAHFVALCQRLLVEGCDGLVPFGTTSEANSLSLAEKLELLLALRGAGIPGEKLLPGTGLCALPETVALTRAALEAGAAGVLLLPPFYYKAVSDDGLYAYVAEVVRRVADDRLRIYLYHIPPVASVGWSPDLVVRLASDFPNVVVGLKDSGGDMAYTREILKRLPRFGAFVGNERFLTEAIELGGAGTITATANVNAKAIRRLHDRWGTSEGEGLNDAVCAYRRAMEGYPTIAANKAVRARLDDAPSLTRVRPPLKPLPEDKAAALLQQLDALGALAPVR